METFLLTIVLSLLLVIVLLALVLRLVFRVARPYPGAILPTVTTSSSHSGGGSVLGVLFLLLILGLAFLFLRQGRPPNDDTLQTPAEYQSTAPSLRQDSTRLPRDERVGQRDLRHTPQPLRVHRQEHIFDADQVEISRYNQAPHPQAARFYGIQVGAFADEFYAKRAYLELREVLPELRILYLIDEEAAFRLVVGEFMDSDAAKAFQRKHQIKGFVRFFDY
ncbi:MAG: SPOR domain-containing protein [Bacteroidetes bacterium]|nr:MAG: SPOR domain-containing protein [Bacteroidota bacterium]